jgi:hypothetical protein
MAVGGPIRSQQLFALVDVNNFYVSCERVFNPALENRPSYQIGSSAHYEDNAWQDNSRPDIPQSLPNTDHMPVIRALRLPEPHAGTLRPKFGMSSVQK